MKKEKLQRSKFFWSSEKFLLYRCRHETVFMKLVPAIHLECNGKRIVFMICLSFRWWEGENTGKWHSFLFLFYSKIAKCQQKKDKFRKYLRIGPWSCKEFSKIEKLFVKCSHDFTVFTSRKRTEGFLARSVCEGSRESEFWFGDDQLDPRISIARIRTVDRLQCWRIGTVSGNV